MTLTRVLAFVTCIAICTSCSTSGGTHSAAKTSTTTTAKGTTTTKASAPATKRLTSGKFSIEVPAGFKIKERSGVYVMADGDRSISYSRTTTDATPEAFLQELLAQLGGEVVSQDSDGTGYTAEVSRDGARELLVIRQEDGAIAVTTGHAPEGGGLDLAEVKAAADSAKGAVSLTPPAPTSSTIELKQYSAPDGGATGMVPADPKWTISSNGGTIEGSSDVGNFVFGVTIQVLTPENAPPAGSGGVIAPYADAASSLGVMIPKLLQGASNVQVTSTAAEGVIDGYTSSGMYGYTYDWNGTPWTGVAIVATDDPSKYGNFEWNWYFTNISVPAGSDGSVGSGLLKAWQSWDPSGAIAQRSQRSKQLLDETNQIWQDTSEFKADQADHQSRDVGCLLQGYYDVEDNSRTYDLPPLPCDQAYGPGN
ncbi:hypothetical protein [Aquihabitans sp. McL0605]|uniref:hypothetical protein n=1 Tax=Aquihabitans sp. McL0605 TaxID=3415671 RepID=UPI003CECA0BD